MPEQTEQTQVTQEQFAIYASSQQAQMKELIFYVKVQNGISFGVLVAVLMVLLFQGFQKLR